MSHTREHNPEHSTIKQHIVRCIVSIFILGLGGAILWWTLHNRGQETLPSDQGDGIPVVQTVAVLPHDGKLKIEVDGIVTPFREIEVATEVGGRIALKGPLVRPGDVGGRASALTWDHTATRVAASIRLDSAAKPLVEPQNASSEMRQIAVPILAEAAGYVETTGADQLEPASFQIDSVARDFVTKEPAFREGDFVSADTVLIVIDQQDYQLEIQRNSQQVAQVDAELTEVRVERMNVTNLMEYAKQQLQLNEAELQRMNEAEDKRQTENRPSGVFSASEFDQVKKAIVASQNAKKSLENQLDSLDAREKRLQVAKQLAQTATTKAKYDLERTVITAPCDGVIVQDFVEAGSYVQKGTPLFVIEDTSSVEVRCNLKMEDLYWLWQQKPDASNADDSRQAAYQIPETEASVSYQIAGRSDLEYTWAGKLTRYDGIGLDERTRTVPCRIVVSDPQDVTVVDRGVANLASEQIRPPALVRGMYVTADILATPNATLVKVPSAAIQPGKWVWRVREGQLQKMESLPLVQYVDDADSGGYWLTPTAGSGLAEGDRLVVTPMIGMRDGMQVREKRDGGRVPKLAD